MSIKRTPSKDNLSADVIDWAQSLKLSEKEKQYGLPAGILAAVMQVESSGDSKAVSPKGAKGLFQFTPATAKAYGIDPFNPEQAADGAARLLRDNLKRFDNNIGLAVAAYNCNPAHIDKYKSQYEKWPNETKAYVPTVLRFAGLSVPADYNFVADENQKFGGTQEQGGGFSFGDFFKGGSIGNILGLVGGGGLGLFLGGLLGNLFGGGLMGTLLKVAFAIGGAMIGANKLGGWINGKSDDHGAPSSPRVGNGRSIDGNQPALANEPQISTQPEKIGKFTSQELDAVVAGAGLNQNAARLKWEGNEVKLQAVSAAEANLAGTLDVARLKEVCGTSNEFTVVRKDGGSHADVKCLAPTPAVTPQVQDRGLRSRPAYSPR